MLEFIQAHTVLFAKEHVHYFDKVKQDRLWEEMGRCLGKSGQDVKRWFESQRTRYSKLTRDQNKSGTGKKFQQTRVLKNFGRAHHEKSSSGDWGVLTDKLCYSNIPERVQRLPYRCG